MSAASETDLGLLHRLMAEQFRKLLAGELTEVVRDKEGNVVGERTLIATAAELSVIRAFLKDNEITAVGEPGSALDELRKKLAQASGKQPAMARADFDVPGSMQ